VPEAVTGKVPPDPVTTVVVGLLVKTGACVMVNVKLWLVVPIPFVAVIVNVYVPIAVPDATDSVLLVLLNETPVGNVSSILKTIVAVPEAVSVKEPPVAPTIAVLFTLVKTGA